MRWLIPGKPGQQSETEEQASSSLQIGKRKREASTKSISTGHSSVIRRSFLKLKRRSFTGAAGGGAFLCTGACMCSTHSIRDFLIAARMPVDKVPGHWSLDRGGGNRSLASSEACSSSWIRDTRSLVPRQAAGVVRQVDSAAARPCTGQSSR